MNDIELTKSVLERILIRENKSLLLKLNDAYSENADLKKHIIIIQLQYDELLTKLETTNPDISSLKSPPLIN
jgi:hypothetical protein